MGKVLEIKGILIEYVDLCCIPYIWRARAERKRRWPCRGCRLHARRWRRKAPPADALLWLTRTPIRPARARSEAGGHRRPSRRRRAGSAVLFRRAGSRRTTNLSAAAAGVDSPAAHEELPHLAPMLRGTGETAASSALVNGEWQRSPIVGERQRESHPALGLRQRLTLALVACGACRGRLDL